MSKFGASIVVALLLCLPLSATAAGAAQTARGDAPLVVFAAASLRTALDQLVQLWQAQQGRQVRVSYAGSSTLARQLAAGAKADIFISASDRWMDYLAQSGRLRAQTRKQLLGNQLVLIAPSGSQLTSLPLTPANITAALGNGYLAMADKAVPAGSYGIAALSSMGAWPQLTTRVAWTQNVRAALALVAKGGAPLGLVYQTDARASNAVKIVARFAAAAHPPIHYPLALLANAQPRAAAFVTFLESNAAANIFVANGFSLPQATAATSHRVRPEPIEAAGNASVWKAVWLSLKVGVWAVLLSLPLALGLSLWLARNEFRGKWLVDALLCLPLVMPPVVTGYLLLLLFSEKGVLGQWLAQIGLPLAFHWQGAVLAAAVMGFPLLVRAIRLSVEALDQRLEQVAASLGAHPLRVFCTITLPLLLPGIGSGLVLAFARAMGEFGATITFVANIPGVTQTLPLALFTELQTPGPLASHDTLLLLGLSLAISLGALVLAELWLQQARKRVLTWN